MKVGTIDGIRSKATTRRCVGFDDRVMPYEKNRIAKVKHERTTTYLSDLTRFLVVPGCWDACEGQSGWYVDLGEWLGERIQLGLLPQATKVEHSEWVQD
mmetsp:Transcript_34231/g.54825  ORF Transcript_34231/g.54825 Transcript_34231/m.54825 type:complete len:99 (+) Transcript_34231:5150-5446(+)